MRFSAIFEPTTLFSLKESNSTNSAAKSLFLPSPYAIKMAILNQSITVGDELEELKKNKSQKFGFIRDVEVKFSIPDDCDFTVNNTFIKILKPSRTSEGFQDTVSFREFLHINGSFEIIFEHEDDASESFLKTYIPKINYFGKRGCFFQFKGFSENPPEPNVKPFSSKQIEAGILQEYDDWPSDATFEKVDNYSSKTIKRKSHILTIPLKRIKSSKSYSHFKAF
jgi:hypothetical protein